MRKAMLVCGALLLAALVLCPLGVRLPVPDLRDGSRPDPERIRGLLRRLDKVFHPEINVEVEVTFGGYPLSREHLFPLMDNRAIYHAYHKSDSEFMHDLRVALRGLTQARNVVIAKPDSLTGTSELISAATLRLTGAVNAEYRLLAFNGAGFLDRRGKPGGHRNWSFSGTFERDGMYVAFLNATAAKGTCDFSGP